MRILQIETAALIECVRYASVESKTEFAAASQIVRKLGGNVQADGTTQFGFWIPDIVATEETEIRLEILQPVSGLDLKSAEQTIQFTRAHLPIHVEGEYAFGVYADIPAGTREQIGAFYWLAFRVGQGEWQHKHDHLACSLPFGCFAPAELYDLNAMHAARQDKAYFENLDGENDPDGVFRIGAPTNILQVHVGTASAEKTIAGLTQIYQTIAEKIENGLALTSAEQNYIGYDGIQLMPIEPTIEYEDGPAFWQQIGDDDDTITVELRAPDMTNWGYDVLTSGSPAVNATTLATKRPDEFVDLIATLHNFPNQPIKVVLDVVYGHTDNQAIPLLNDEFMAGANMYGQNMRYKHPVTRAYLLEMQRRKSDFGVDGVRVDGAQDFKYWVPETDELIHDDDFLSLMNDVEQAVAGVTYRPWMIFEDGRPWPREDWELASSYLEVTKQFPNVVQWGPLTFAHNTPFLFTFWISKWWRIREIMQVGAAWITGCANHDTLRRGTQVPLDARVNSYLGDTLPDIFKNGYDNPAATLFTYAISPGVPMDFINALHRAPWAFIRNTDSRWGVKVVSEESRFLYWVMNEALWEREDTFVRLKDFGFESLEHLRKFMILLDKAVQGTDYNLEAIASVMDASGLYESCSVNDLKTIARLWMDDKYDFCNVSRYEDSLDLIQTAFNLATREFRRSRPWLLNNLGENDLFDYIYPTDGSIVFYGLRHAPDGEQILFLANMEGEPAVVDVNKLGLGVELDGWEVALQSPDLVINDVTRPITLANSQGVVFTKIKM